MSKNAYFKSGRLWIDDVLQPGISVPTLVSEMELYFQTGNARYSNLIPVFDAMTRFFNGSQTADDVESYQDLFDKLEDHYRACRDESLVLESLYGRQDHALYRVKDPIGYTAGPAVIVDLAQIVDDELGLVVSGATWKFTARTAGLYLASGFVSFTGSGIRYLSLYKNGAAFLRVGYSYTAQTNDIPLSALPVRLASGDYLDLRVTVTDPSTLTVDSWLSISKLSN